MPVEDDVAFADHLTVNKWPTLYCTVIKCEQILKISPELLFLLLSMHSAIDKATYLTSLSSLRLRYVNEQDLDDIHQFISKIERFCESK